MKNVTKGAQRFEGMRLMNWTQAFVFAAKESLGIVPVKVQTVERQCAAVKTLEEIVGRWTRR